MVTILAKNLDETSEFYGQTSRLQFRFRGSDAELVESCSILKLEVIEIIR